MSRKTTHRRTRGARLVSRAALAYARLFRESRVSPARQVHSGRAAPGLQVVTGLPSWAYPRGGICVGNVFLTGSAPSQAVLGHEAVHAQQWERYGLSFPLLYALAGSNPVTNRFEVEAGLQAGGYPTEPQEWSKRGGRRGAGTLMQQLRKHNHHVERRHRG